MMIFVVASCIDAAEKQKNKKKGRKGPKSSKQVAPELVVSPPSLQGTQANQDFNFPELRLSGSGQLGSTLPLESRRPGNALEVIADARRMLVETPSAPGHNRSSREETLRRELRRKKLLQKPIDPVGSVDPQVRDMLAGFGY